MRFLENLVADLIRDATGLNARRLVRRVGGRRLLLGGLAAAGGFAFTRGDAAGVGAVGPPGTAAPPPAAVPPPPPAAPPTAAVPPPPPAAPPAAAVPPPVPPAFEAAEASGGDLPAHLAYPAVRTMVAAALADGRLAPEEKAAIRARLGDSGFDEARVAQVHQDLVLPPTVEELAELVTAETDRETLYQLAAAVLQADQRVSDLERVWLGRLGAAFELAEERRRVLQDEAFAPGGDGAPRA